MSASFVESLRHYALDPVFTAIAAWVSNYRYACRVNDELTRCSPDEVARIAQELGVTAEELSTLATKGPEAANLLQRMLVALGVDPKTLPLVDPMAMRDLQRLCITCDHKKQCEHDLVAGSAADNYRTYCRNAYALDALFKLK